MPPENQNKNRPRGHHPNFDPPKAMQTFMAQTEVMVPKVSKSPRKESSSVCSSLTFQIDVSARGRYGRGSAGCLEKKQAEVCIMCNKKCCTYIYIYYIYTHKGTKCLNLL